MSGGSTVGTLGADNGVVGSNGAVVVAGTNTKVNGDAVAGGAVPHRRRRRDGIPTRNANPRRHPRHRSGVFGDKTATPGLPGPGAS